MSEALPEPSETEASDASLITRIREGDVSAYGVLYERHAGAARRLARHLLSGETEAEDTVSETFTKVLSVLQRGGGPQSAFRPYLLTAVRRTVYDRYRSDKKLTPTDEIEAYDSGVPFVDPALAGLERNLIMRAFLSLPERWQVVLWHTEIEGGKPAEVAPLLGLTANGVAALAYRAREGLREAYLQMHIAEGPREECRPALERLGGYVRGGLAKRDAALVERHLDGCTDCKAIYAELADVNTTLRTGVGPLVLGLAAAGYLAAAKGGTAIGGWLFGWWRAVRRLPKRQQQGLAAGTAVAAAAVALAAFLLVGNSTPIQRHPIPPPAAEQPPAVPPKPQPPHAAQPPQPAAPAAPAAPGGPPRKPAPQKPAPAKPAAPVPPAQTPPPTPAPSTSPPVEPDLIPEISTVGVLVRSSLGIVAISVHNHGAGRSQQVTAEISLPPGVSFLGAATGRSSARFIPFFAPGGDWSCRPTQGQVVRCTHATIQAHGIASAYLHVTVAADAPYGTPPRVLLVAGTAKPITAKADSGVQGTGMPARFATDGHLRTEQVGNALQSCQARETGCQAARARKGPRRDNDLWRMRPLKLDRDPTTTSASSARLSVPVGGQILWAGLYWSGVVCGGRPTARLKGPGAKSYATVRPAQTARSRFPGYWVYQSFADVTAEVRTRGGGEWWVADVPSRAGVGTYAGWSLVAVVQDPKEPLNQVMVLDGNRTVLPWGSPVDIPIAGLLAAAAPARIGLVGWEGDADLKGDRLLLDGKPLTPKVGDRDPNNVMDSSANGAVGPALTFGTNVDLFSAVLGRRQTLRLVTGGDAYLVGVVTVTAAMRS